MERSGERDTTEAGPAVPFRLQAVMVAVAMAALGFGMLLLPGIGPMIRTLLLWFLAALAILGVAMGLARFGFLLLGAVDRLVSWQTREPEWFQPPSPSDEPGEKPGL